MPLSEEERRLLEGGKRRTPTTTPAGGGSYIKNRERRRAEATQARSEGGPSSLAGQLTGIVRSVPGGLAHLAAGVGKLGAETVASPVLLPYRIQDDLRRGKFDWQRYTPDITEEFAESGGRTVGRLRHPSRYAEASKEGTILGTVLEDVGNLSIVGGAAGRAVGRAGKIGLGRAAPLAAERYAAARVAAKDTQAAARAARATAAGTPERAAAMEAVRQAREASVGAREAAGQVGARSRSLIGAGERIRHYARLGDRVAGGPAEVYAAPIRAAGRYLAKPAWRRFAETEAGQALDAVLTTRVREPWARHQERARFAREDYERRQRPSVETGGEVVSAATRALRAVKNDDDLAVAANVLSAQAHKPLLEFMDRHLDETAELLGVDRAKLAEEWVAEGLGPSVSPRAWRIIESYERETPPYATEGSTVPARRGETTLDATTRARVDEARKILDEEVYAKQAARYVSGWGARDPLTEEGLEYRSAQEGDAPNPVLIRRKRAEAEERYQKASDEASEAQREADRLAGRRILSPEEYGRRGDKLAADTMRRARATAAKVVKEDRDLAMRAAGYRGRRAGGDAPEATAAERATAVEEAARADKTVEIDEQLATLSQRFYQIDRDIPQVEREVAMGYEDAPSRLEALKAERGQVQTAYERLAASKDSLVAEAGRRARAKQPAPKKRPTLVGRKEPTDAQLTQRLANRLLAVGEGRTKNAAMLEVLDRFEPVPNPLRLPDPERMFGPGERYAANEAQVEANVAQAEGMGAQAGQARTQLAGLEERRPIAPVSEIATRRLERAVGKARDAVREAKAAARKAEGSSERGRALTQLRRDAAELRRAVLGALKENVDAAEGLLQQLTERYGAIKMPTGVEEYRDLLRATGGPWFKVGKEPFWRKGKGRVKAGPRKGAGTEGEMDAVIDLWGQLRNIDDPKVALDDLTNAIRVYRQAKATLREGGIKAGLGMDPRQAEYLLGYELDEVSKQLLVGDISEAAERAIAEGGDIAGDVPASVRQRADETAAAAERAEAEVVDIRGDTQRRIGQTGVRMGLAHGRREGVLEGRAGALETEAGYAEGRAERAAGANQGIDPYEQRVEATGRLAGTAADIGRKAGEREVAARTAEKALTRAQARLAKAAEALDRAVPDAANSPEAVPAKYAEALRASGNLKAALTARAEAAIEEAAIVGNPTKAAEAQMFLVLANDLPENFGDLQFAGVKEPVFRAGVELNPEGKRGVGATREARLPYSKLGKEQKFKTRTEGTTDWGLRPQIRDVVTRVHDGYRNEFARWVESREGFGRKASDVLGPGGPRGGVALARAMREQGFVAWNRSSPLKIVNDADVNPTTTFIPKHVFDRFEQAFGGPGGAERWFQKWYDRKFLGTIKVGWLPLSPKWLTGNVVGNMLMGMAETGIGDYLRALPSAIAMYLGEDPNLPRTLFNRGYTHEEIQFIMAEIPKRQGRIARGARATVAWGYRGNEFVDNVSRSAIYLAKMKRGASPSQALERALRAAGDFQRMSRYERSVVKRIWVFYPWYRHITKLTLSLPIEHPMRVAWALHLGEMFGDPEDQEGLPGFLHGAIRTGEDRFVRPGGLVPFNTGGEDSPLLSPTNALRSITPAASWPAALLFGFDLTTLKPLSRPPGTASLDAYGREKNTRMNAGELAYWLASQFPQPRAAFAAGVVPGYRERVARYRTGQPILREGRKIPLGYDRGDVVKGFLGIPYEETVDVEGIERRRKEAKRNAERTRRRYEARR